MDWPSNHHFSTELSQILLRSLYQLSEDNGDQIVQGIVASKDSGVGEGTAGQVRLHRLHQPPLTISFEIFSDGVRPGYDQGTPVGGPFLGAEIQYRSEGRLR